MFVIIATYKTVAPDAWGPFKSEEEALAFAYTIGLPKHIQLSPDETWRQQSTKEISITLNYLLPGNIHV